jgi:glycine cleavage system H protein
LSHIPDDLKYTKSHEWVRQLQSGQVEIGVTDHAQSALGDLVFVDVPQVGRLVTAGTAVAVVESVKAASDVYAPCSGKVIASNADLASRPELLNQEPYGGGWLLRIDTTGATPGAPLLTPSEYTEFLASGAK